MWEFVSEETVITRRRGQVLTSRFWWGVSAQIVQIGVMSMD